MSAPIPDHKSPSPDVSFAIACYNAGEFLQPAVESALAQVGVNVEVIIVDDGSSDGSLQRARDMAVADSRIRVYQTPSNGGPGAARNVALGVMYGTWYAILDSDDLISPERSRSLIEAADRVGADMIADDMTVFGDDVTSHSLIGKDVTATGRWIDMDFYLHRSRMFSSAPGLGFLKPMIRRVPSPAAELRYNDELRIGEDDELIVRLLADGARYWMVPNAMYFYRKHGESISHRLSVDNANRMVAAEHDIENYVDSSIARSRTYRRRKSSIHRARAFVTSVDQLKARKPFAALGTLLSYPSAIPLYRMPLAAAIRRMGRE